MPASLVSARRNNRSLLILYALGFVLAVSTALPAYIQSNFLEGFVTLPTVSLFVILSNFLTAVAIIFFPDWVRRLTNGFLTKVVLIAFFVSALWLSMAASTLNALLALILFSVASNLIWINMDFLVEGFTRNATTGRTRTIYFTAINAGWTIAPISASYLVAYGGYTLTFLISGFCLIPFFLIFLWQEKKLRDRTQYSREKTESVAAKVWRNKNLRGIFSIAFLLQLFYASAVVYIPVYLHQNLGIDWQSLGVMFSIMLLPFLLFEIPAGIMADKYFGEKGFLLIGFTVLTLSLFSFYCVNTGIVWLWTIILFASRTGAALIEAMRETYFFKIVNAADVGYIDLFRLTTPLAYVVGPGLAILTLAFLPLNYLFLILAVLMLSGFYFVASLQDTKRQPSTAGIV